MKLVGVCQYDGSNYSGFQSQTNANAIQDVLERAISSVGKLNDRINFSGRTDAGVHAVGQVFDFSSPDLRKIDQWLKGINSNLPPSISVISLQKGPKDFHSRFDATSRSYGFVLYTGVTRPVFLRNYVQWEQQNLDVHLMRSEATYLEGTHNFNAFRGSKCIAKNPNRTIKAIEIIERDNFLIFYISANAYLYNMVRIIVGTLIDIGKGVMKQSVIDILDSQNRKFAGRTAQSNGLFFLGSSYNKIKLDQQNDLLNLYNFLRINEN